MDFVRRRVICVLVLLALALSSCFSEEADNHPLLVESPTEVPIVVDEDDIPMPPVYVYEGASEDFLLPLDDYSWEREHDAEFVMIHFTSAVVSNRANPYEWNAVRALFEGNEVSVHYIIDREGVVTCLIPENRVAWHAGKGEFADDEKYTNAMNHYAIGIELMGIGSEADMADYLYSWEYRAIDKSQIGFTDAQYDALSSLVRDICERNEIPYDRDHVIGHEEYSPTKTDPGELFEWERVFE